MSDAASEEFRALKREVLEAMRAGWNALGEVQFNALALRIHSFQLRANASYRAYCDALGDAAPVHWTQIPAMPASAFKRGRVLSIAAQVANRWFQTSGTTEGESGRHYFDDFELYEQSLLPTFAHFAAVGQQRWRMLILTPPVQEAPHSSLAHMMQCVRDTFGTEGSRHVVAGGEVEFDALFRALEEATRVGEKVMLLGTGFAFMHTLDEMDRRGLSFHLQGDTRIMETGGFKGRSREMPREQFYPRLARAFNLPLHAVVNEYGMTELSSQFYDVSAVEGQATDWKAGPAWARVRAVDPLTLRPVVDGETGLLRVTDLANLASVAFLQTEDVGICRGEQFRVLGRVDGALRRGCSIGAEDLLGRGAVRDDEANGR